MTKIFSNTLLFAMFFAGMTTGAAAEVRFTLSELGGWKTLDDPLMVRAALLVGDFVGDYEYYASEATILGRAGTPEVARIMLEAGADVNGGDDPPILSAVSGDVLEVFLEAGADVSPEKVPQAKLYGVTVLCYAPDAKAVRLLLAAGVPVDEHVKKNPLTPLCCAKNAAVTRALLEAGANPRFKTKDGFTPLHFAPDAESVRLLIAAGANVNAKSDSGLTPLHDPADAACARALIKAGADVHALAAPKSLFGFGSSNHWMTPLAALFTVSEYETRHCRRVLPPEMKSQPERKYDREVADRNAIARVLIEAGADADEAGSHVLWRTSSPELLPLLLEHGLDVNMRDEKGRTPLMVTSDPIMTAKLIAAGADVNARDETGCTALMVASDPEVTAQLIAAGADVNIRDNDGKTALDRAWGVDTIKILIDAGADPLKTWVNPLLHASNAEAFLLYLKLMQDAGWDVKAYLDAQDEDGNTPLMAMLTSLMRPVEDLVPELEFDPNRRDMQTCDLLPVLRAMQAAGADLTIRNKHGQTLLFYARKPETVRLLLDAGLRADAANESGLTPLHEMMEYGVPVETLRLMLAAGADADARSAWGMTPLLNLSVCWKFDLLDVPAQTRLLLDAGADVDARPHPKEPVTWGSSPGEFPGEFTPLHRMKDPDAARMLIAAGADIEARMEDDMTPLHAHVYVHPYMPVESSLAIRVLLAGAKPQWCFLAECATTPEVAQIMLDAGAKMDKETLFWVRDARMAKFFVDAGAKVNVYDDGYTPLICSPSGDVTEVLLSAGAKVNTRRKGGNFPVGTALHYAPDAKAVRLLVEAGAKVEAMSGGVTPLCSAANAEVTRALLEAGADACFESENGLTPLHFARDAESVRLLLQAGAEVDAVAKYGLTPLHFARDAESVRLLLQAGAEVNAVAEYGLTPLLMATSDLPFNFVISPFSFMIFPEGPPKLWCSCYRTRNERPGDSHKFVYMDDAEQEAMERNIIERVRLLVEAGADVNAASEEGHTPLMLVAGLPEAVRLLLDAGASVEVFDSLGWTALHRARPAESVRMLIKAGAVVDARDLESRTPLFYACEPESMQVLLDAGADLWVKDIHDETPLYSACPDCVEFLLDAMRKAGLDDEGIKAALNTRSKKGRTATAALCEYSRNYAMPELLRVIVPAGANVNVRDEDGRSPLFYADCAETAQCLLDAGADVNARDKKRATPLHVVLSSRLEMGLWHDHENAAAKMEVVRLLLVAGADVNARGEDGRTPYFSAFTPEMRDVLIQAGADPDAKDYDGKSAVNIRFGDDSETWDGDKNGGGHDENWRDNLPNYGF